MHLNTRKAVFNVVGELVDVDSGAEKVMGGGGVASEKEEVITVADTEPPPCKRPALAATLPMDNRDDLYAPSSVSSSFDPVTAVTASTMSLMRSSSAAAANALLSCGQDSQQRPARFPPFVAGGVSNAIITGTTAKDMARRWSP